MFARDCSTSMPTGVVPAMAMNTMSPECDRLNSVPPPPESAGLPLGPKTKSCVSGPTPSRAESRSLSKARPSAKRAPSPGPPKRPAGRVRRPTAPFGRPKASRRPSRLRPRYICICRRPVPLSRSVSRGFRCPVKSYDTSPGQVNRFGLCFLWIKNVGYVICNTHFLRLGAVAPVFNMEKG